MGCAIIGNSLPFPEPPRLNGFPLPNHEDCGLLRCISKLLHLSLAEFASLKTRAADFLGGRKGMLSCVGAIESLFATCPMVNRLGISGGFRSLHSSAVDTSLRLWWLGPGSLCKRDFVNSSCFDRATASLSSIRGRLSRQFHSL